MNKKTFALLGILILTASTPLLAQLKLGLKVHPLLSYVRPDTKDYKNDGLTAGFSYGLMVENRFAENYSFYTEFAVTHKGGRTIFDNPAKREETTYKFQYIEVPFALKLRTDEINGITYYGLFGLAGGVVFRSSQDKVVTDHSTKEVKTSTGEDFPTYRLSAALLFGGGMEYALSEKTFVIAGLSYNNGFTNIANYTTSNGEVLKLTCSYIALNLGLLF